MRGSWLELWAEQQLAAQEEETAAKAEEKEAAKGKKKTGIMGKVWKAIITAVTSTFATILATYVSDKVTGKKTKSKTSALVLIYKTPTGLWTRQIYQITTDPGRYYMLNPTNRKGTAILVPGQ